MENISDNPNVLPVLSLVVAALAVFIGPVFSWLGGRQQTKTSLLIANKQLIAPMRQIWINNLRELLAELLGKTNHYYVSGYDNRSDEEYARITTLLNQLELFINPYEKNHIELLSEIKRMLGLLDEGESQGSFEKTHLHCTKLSQSVLKEEWDRIKEEI